MKYLKLLPIACMLLTPAINAKDVIVDSGDIILISDTNQPLSSAEDFSFYKKNKYDEVATRTANYVVNKEDKIKFPQNNKATAYHKYEYPALLVQAQPGKTLEVDSIYVDGLVDGRTNSNGQNGFHLRGTRKLQDESRESEITNSQMTIKNGVHIGKTAKLYSGEWAAMNVKDLAGFTGDIINHGYIEGMFGDEATAMGRIKTVEVLGHGLVLNTVITGKVENYGIIKADLALKIGKPISKHFINYGTIQGNLAAVNIEKISNPTNSNNECVIDNHGKISGTAIAIVNRHADAITINNSCTIDGMIVMGDGREGNIKLNNNKTGYINGFLRLGNDKDTSTGEFNNQGVATISSIEHKINITNSGELTLGSGQTITEFDNSSGKLMLQPTNTGFTILTVDGTATLTNSTVALDPKASFFKDKELFTVEGKKITIVTATKLEGSKPKVESNHFRLTIVENLGIDDNKLSATVSIKSLTSILDEVKIPQEQKKFAEQLAKDTPAMNTIASVYGSIDELHSVEKIKECIAQLKPDTTSTETSATTNITGNLLQGISARGSSTNSGLNSGDGINNSDVWWQYLKNHATQASSDDALGYKSTTSGLTLGFDHDFNNIKAGVAFNFANAKINFERDQAINILQTAVAVYGIVPHNNLVVGASASYSHANNEISRLKGEAAVNGEHKATSISGQLWLATEHKVLTCSLQPKISLRGYNVNVDTYTLANPDATITETHSKLEKSSVALGVGASIEKTIVNNGTIFTPRLAVDYFRNLNETTKGGEINFAGEEYLTTGTIIKHKFESQSELAIQHKQFTFSITHVFSKMKDYHANSIFAKVKYNF